MVLDHVAYAVPVLVVERAPALDSEVFGHGDLHVSRRVPHSRTAPGSRWRSGRTACDAPAACRGNGRCERSSSRRSSRSRRAVEDLRRREVTAEGLLDDDAERRWSSRIGPAVPRRARTASAGWRGKYAGRSAEPSALRMAWNVAGSLVVAVDVAQQAAQRAERRGIDPLRACRGCPRRGPANCSRFQPAFATPMTGTSRLPRFTIACSAGRSSCTRGRPSRRRMRRHHRLDVAHRVLPFRPPAFRGWPPNSKRMAESSFVAEVRLAARAEPLVQRGGEDRSRHRLRRWPRGSSTGPRRNRTRAPGSLELRVLDECRGGQVEEPGGDDAARVATARRCRAD